MSRPRLTGKQLRNLGYPEGPVISIAMNVMSRHYKHYSEEAVLQILKTILDVPADYIDDVNLGLIARSLMPKPVSGRSEIALNATGIQFNVFGAEHIEEGALQQMYTAARLPVAIAGALMPDAHQGYGLPIGGVFAAENAVIPYGVGVDIGCRMCLSVFDMNPNDLVEKEKFFSRELNEATLFGAGQEFRKPSDHAILEHPLFDQMPLLKGLQDRAWKQLGSSGSGNHFAEFGTVEIAEKDTVLGIEPGPYLGFLTHSGSRALGANIANYYTKLAKEKRNLPTEAASLAWFGLDEEEGQEYWLAMNLAGDYASACHHVIHDKIALQLGRKPITRVENHHNFAWKEIIGGKELIVHRKGATPAGKDVLGIIPGSMTAAGYIVKGKGETASLQSASHGAGRRMSRSQALRSVTQNQLKDELEKHGVKLVGGGLDEAPFAYKDIEVVMQSQKALVEIVGKFFPKIVKMDGSAPKKWRKQRELGE